MTKSQFNKIMKEVHSVKEDGPVDDEAAFDMAEFFLWRFPGLKAYIQNTLHIGDAKGWLADEI